MEAATERIAAKILACCLDGRDWAPDDLRLLLERDSGALFRVVVEGLADRFEPALCDVYARLFSEVLAHAVPELNAAALLERYGRIRRPPPKVPEPRTVFVLSRITLGADVAVASVMLDAARRRFPNARIVFAGPRKNWELFAGDGRIEHLEAGYHRRGSLAERLQPWRLLQAALSEAGSLVIDPDSRLTQLGLLPVCPEDRYFFFESRGYGGAGHDPLPALAAQWAMETFGVEAKPYVAPACGPLPSGVTCVSLGVGENPSKRIADPFEEEILRCLAERTGTVLVDEGAGGEESHRVLRAIARAGVAGGRLHSWRGPFAPFAAAVARARLYVGYDSAGQHVAAACGVPLATIFAGSPSPRFFSRWRPAGPGQIEVVRADDAAPRRVLGQAMGAIGALLGGGCPSRRERACASGF